MIFVTVGSQKFQFNRLLIEIDRLVEEGKIKEDIFAQTGYSDYKPKNYKYKNFLDREEFEEIMSKCDKVITHGGTGAIIGAIKNKKKVIAIPRLKKFSEHVDNHQCQITKQFLELELLETIEDLEELEKLLGEIELKEYKEYYSNTETIINSIDNFISTN